MTNPIASGGGEDPEGPEAVPAPDAVARASGPTAPHGAAAEELRALVAAAGADHRPLDRWLAPGGPEAAEDAAVRVTADALRAFLARRAEALAARERAAAMHDHRRLGRELGLFDTDPLIGAGLPYWLPD
ncbi:hypothetical protein, partial [Streptomyces roseolus]|uniref:hypothetical protein n=1 Tax=Streptomyces roseolus TaxID=67358 RepID=UPI0036685870